MKLKLHFFILITLITSSLFAQKLEVTVSRNKLPLNQKLLVEFSITGQNSDNFTPPKFNNFKVLGIAPHRVQERIFNNNGQITRIIKSDYTYEIQPKRQGILAIESASISVNGKIVRSNPVRIRVTKAKKIPADPSDPTYLAEQGIHLVTHINNTNPYVGEGIFVEYRLFAKKEIMIQHMGFNGLRKYEGFWSQKIKGGNRGWIKGEFEGDPYLYKVIERALLIPTKSGELNVDEMTKDLIVAFPRLKEDHYGNKELVVGKEVRKTFTSPKRIIKVKELPTENCPKSFNGAVGDFDFSVLLSKKSLKANESSEIVVAVRGQGNMESFKLPKIETPDELEIYAPERRSKLAVMPNGVKGILYEVYKVVPQYKGVSNIPSLEFSYFNPTEKKYHIINSKELMVDVLEGKELPKTIKKVKKEKVKSVGKEFRDSLQESNGFQSKEISIFFNSFWYYILLTLPLLAIPVAIFIRKKEKLKQGDLKGNKIRTSNKLAKKYLAEAENNLGEKDAFYESLERALHNYLKASLGVETCDISRYKITDLLKNKNVNQETISEFMNVLNDCDFARYTPTTNIEMESEYQKAKNVILELDTYF